MMQYSHYETRALVAFTFQKKKQLPSLKDLEEKSRSNTSLEIAASAVQVMEKKIKVVSSTTTFFRSLVLQYIISHEDRVVEEKKAEADLVKKKIQASSFVFENHITRILR